MADDHQKNIKATDDKKQQQMGIFDEEWKRAKRKQQWEQQQQHMEISPPPSTERSPSPQTLASPICPSCNRHFPRLRGDIRRHVSQCQRLKKLGEASNGLDNSQTDTENGVNGNGTICLSPASVDPSNPYQCRWCQFITLYKGNMKRHLVTCHQVSVTLLNRIQFDVERLRKLSERRPIWDELPIRPRRDGRDDGWTEGEEGGMIGDSDNTENGGPNSVIG